MKLISFIASRHSVLDARQMRPERERRLYFCVVETGRTASRRLRGRLFSSVNG